MCVRGYLSNHHTCLIGIALRDFCPVTMMERNNNPMLLSNWLRDTRNPNKRNVLRWRVWNALYYTRPMLAAHNWGRERSSSSDRSRCFDDNGPKATRVPLSCLSALYDLLAPPRRCAALHYCVCVSPAQRHHGALLLCWNQTLTLMAPNFVRGESEGGPKSRTPYCLLQ